MQAKNINDAWTTPFLAVLDLERLWLLVNNMLSKDSESQ